MKGQANNLTLPPLEEILNFFRQEVNELLKNLLENLMLEEGSIYLEQQKRQCKWLFTRNLLTKYEGIEGLRVPRGEKKGAFAPLYFFYQQELIKVTKEEVKAWEKNYFHLKYPKEVR